MDRPVYTGHLGEASVHWAPLDWLVSCASRQVVKQLLDANADPTLKDRDQLEAIHFAANSSHTEV